MPRLRRARPGEVPAMSPGIETSQCVRAQRPTGLGRPSLAPNWWKNKRKPRVVRSPSQFKAWRAPRGLARVAELALLRRTNVRFALRCESACRLLCAARGSGESRVAAMFAVRRAASQHPGAADLTNRVARAGTRRPLAKLQQRGNEIATHCALFVAAQFRCRVMCNCSRQR